MEKYALIYPSQASELKERLNGIIPQGWYKDLPSFLPDVKGEKTRSVCGKAMNESVKNLPALMGGSGDLDPSTQTALKNMGDYEHPAAHGFSTQGSAGGVWGYAGRNIHYGVREHAMGSITNGLSLHGGILPFASTFLIFSDYMRPSIRLASIMKRHVIYIFTHDSIGLGEDGPTHQPVEHLASLRAMPEIVVIRPCDANETVEAWKIAVDMKDRPVALILTRQDVPTLDRNRYAPASGLANGAYILYDPPVAPRIILIATGSEVQLITAAADRLNERNIPARCVSIPSWELFEMQSREYRDSVLPSRITKRLSVEAGVSLGWERYIGSEGKSISIDRFGASAPGKVNMEKFGFTADNVFTKAMELIEKGTEAQRS